MYICFNDLSEKRITNEKYSMIPIMIIFFVIENLINFHTGYFKKGII